MLAPSGHHKLWLLSPRSLDLYIRHTVRMPLFLGAPMLPCNWAASGALRLQRARPPRSHFLTYFGMLRRMMK